MTKIALIFFVLFSSFSNYQCSDVCYINLSPEEVAIYECSDRYGIPSSLLKGIRYAECNNNPENIWSNSYDVVIKQRWFYTHPARKMLEKKYGHKIG